MVPNCKHTRKHARKNIFESGGFIVTACGAALIRRDDTELIHVQVSGLRRQRGTAGPAFIHVIQVRVQPSDRSLRCNERIDWHRR